MSETETPNPFAARSATNPHGALYREVVIPPSASDAPTDGPIEIALSSEAPVERFDWLTGECYVEVLDHSPTAGPDLSYAVDGLPFCADHDIDDQIGLVEALRLDADRVLRGTVRQGNHPDAPWLFADMRAGIRKKVSIGYWPGETYTQSKDASGQIIRRYTGWTLYEASTVAVPADYAVGVGRSGKGAASPESIPQSPATVARTTEHSMSAETALERGTAPTPDTRAADLAILADSHNRHADLSRWIRDGLSVAQVKDQLLAEITARAAAQPHIATSTVVDAMHERAADKPWEAGEFIRAVVTAAKTPHNLDVRLAASARSQNTNTGADGGFAVPPAVVTTLLSAQKTGGELLSRVTERPVTTGNIVKEVLVKEESRVSGSRSGGLRYYWVAQEGAITVSQAKLRELELNVKKIACAIPVTEEQIEDGPQLISFLQEQVPEELKFGKELAIWSGSGAGMPLGFMSSGALVTQAIEATQTIANTADFIWKNAANMMTRMNPQAFSSRGVWFINSSLWAKIVTATAGASANGAATAFTAPGRLSEAPMGALYGRPIVPVEYASAEGTVGDFVLADLSDYLLAQKGGTRFAQSMHVEFLNDKQTLKFTERVDGQPRTRVPMTPFNGSNTVSPYVALAARS